jgi:hypothetical protein
LGIGQPAQSAQPLAVHTCPVTHAGTQTGATPLELLLDDELLLPPVPLEVSLVLVLAPLVDPALLALELLLVAAVPPLPP